MEDIKYPIYRFSLYWYQDGKHDSDYPGRHIGLPEGKTWNSTNLRVMYKEDQEKRILRKFIIDWWDKYKTERLSDKNPSTPVINIELFDRETWNLTWFTHETFDVGQSDAEALASFERYVQRKEAKNAKHRYETGEDIDKFCLMGAEDRWRWRGANDEGEADSSIPPPCRCKHCKKAGMIRIIH